MPHTCMIFFTGEYGDAQCAGVGQIPPGPYGFFAACSAPLIGGWPIRESDDDLVRIEAALTVWLVYTAELSSGLKKTHMKRVRIV